MKTMLMLLLIAVPCIARSQTDANLSNYRLITPNWDSTAIHMESTFGKSILWFNSLSPTDTMYYFFGSHRRDSTTSAIYRLLPGKEKKLDLNAWGSKFSVLFRRSKAPAGILSQFEQWPYVER